MKGSLCRLAETSFLWRDTAMRIRERFNPRAPWGATATTTSSVVHALFQPMRPLRGATAPLWRRSRRSRISTHAPLAGRDTSRAITVYASTLFQPTRPLRGATFSSHAAMSSERISTHAPLAGRDREVADDPSPFSISTHAPLAGRDNFSPRFSYSHRYFNPRAPCGARH